MEKKNGIVLDGQFYEAVSSDGSCVWCDLYKKCKEQNKSWMPCKLFNFSIDNRVIFKKSQSQKFSQTIINQNEAASLIIGELKGTLNIG